MHSVLKDDAVHREALTGLYRLTMEYVQQLPAGRKKEINQTIPEFEQKLKSNVDSVQKSECAILVAGKFCNRLY